MFTNHSTVLVSLKTIFSKLLHLDPAELPTDESLLEIGADSLILVEAIRRIEQNFSVKLKIRQLFEELTTLSEIAQYIIDQQSSDSESTEVEKEETKQLLSDFIAELLQLSKEEINFDDPLLELGADSLILVELVRRIEKEFGAKITIRQFFEEFLTINDIAAHLDSKISVSLEHNMQVKAEEIIEKKENVIPFKMVQDSGLESNKESHWSLNNKEDLLDLTPQQSAYIKFFIEQYNKKTSKSKKISSQYNRRLCHGRRSFAVLREQTLPLFYTIHAKESSGSKFTDVDGNEYIDIAMGFGIHLFGHSPDFLIEALNKQLKLGLQLGPEHPDTGEVASLLNEITGCDRFTFCNTGTEAVMTAIRIARASTKRQKIAVFKNSYHGHFDSTLVVPDLDKGNFQAKPMALGSPPSMAEDVVVLDFAKESALNYIRQYGHELAAVIVEPVQNRRPDLHPREFLQQLRTITLETKTVLLFDEILVGFRIAQGGAQEWFNVKADMVTYGKIIGGGIPISVIGGTQEIMSYVDGGTEDLPWGARTETTYTAGTYVKNPLAISAMKALLLEMKKKGKCIQESLNENSSQLAARITALFNKYDVPFEINAFGSFFRFSQAGNLSFVYRPLELDLFSYHMIHNGIYLWEGGTCFLSTAHSQQDIDKIVQAAETSVQQLLSGGFFNNQKPQTMRSANV